MKALPVAVALLEAACKISPHRPELWLHLGRLRAASAIVNGCREANEEDAEAGTARDKAMEDLETALALAKDFKGAPSHTEICARLYLGKQTYFSIR